MNKGYALGFLLVLLVVVLGFYVAYTGFVSTRETVRAQATSAQAAAPATPRPTRPAPTATVTATVPVTSSLPISIPGITATLTAVLLPGATAAPTTTLPPATLPTDTPSPATTPSAQPPTPVPISQYEFRLGGPAGPDSTYPDCCYIYGTVRDAAGQGLEGVEVRVVNQWGAVLSATSKGGADLGRYDVPLNREAILWAIMLVDASGAQISTQVPVPFDPLKFNAYRVDWQRSQ